MANEKNPAINDDLGTTGSSEELDEYGVWVKSEPQDFFAADEADDHPAESFDDAELTLDESLSISDDIAADTISFDKSGTGEEEIDLEISLDDYAGTSSDSSSSGDIVPEASTDAGIAETGEREDFAGENDSSRFSTQLLLKIADELSSIKTEIYNLKQELSTARAGTSPEVSGEANGKAGFFGDNDDEKIALTGDELDNILQTVDFTEESGADAAEDTSAEEPSEVSGEIPAIENSAVDLDLPDSSEPEVLLEPEVLPEPAAEPEADISGDALSLTGIGDFDLDEDFLLDDTEPAFSEESSEQVLLEQAPLEQVLLEQVLLEQVPLEQAPLEQVPLEQAPLDISFDETPEKESFAQVIPEGFEVESPVSEIFPDDILASDEDDAAPGNAELIAEDFSPEDPLSGGVFDTVARDEPVPEDEILLDDDLQLPPDISVNMEDDLDSTQDEILSGSAEDEDFFGTLELPAGEDSLEDLTLLSGGDIPGDPELPAEEDILSDIDISTDEPDRSSASSEDLTLPSEEDTLDNLELPTEEDTLSDLELPGNDFDTTGDFGDLELPAEDDTPGALVPQAEEDMPTDIKIPANEDDPANLELPADDDVLEDSELPSQAETPVRRPDAVPEPAAAGSEIAAVPPKIRNELRTVLSYMDKLLESLPEEKVEEFAQSEYYDTYKKLFEELGLA